jgi:hypothetical protein
MNTRSKIVGLTRQMPDSLGDQPEIERDIVGASEEASSSALEVVDEPPTYYYDEFAEPSVWRKVARFIVPGALIAAFTGWTAFFLWAHTEESRAGVSNDRIIQLVTGWAVPTMLIAVLWLVAMRNSSREARRFGDVALLLRDESLALTERMRTVNEEISLAREFLAQNARELETVGRQSARQLTESAEQLSAALADSDQKAKTLETVSNAATSNLDQLRKHLPVVTSAAKDITNQIGSAGNDAQAQISALVVSLERVTEAGKNAHEYLDRIEERANEVGGNLKHTIGSSTTLLDESTATASTRTAEMAVIMERATDGLTCGVRNATAQIDEVLAASHDNVQAQLAALRTSLSDLSLQSADEQNRVSNIIGDIAAHIETSARRIGEVDRAATDQTARLAFAVSALGESTKDVGAALTHNQDITEHLIGRTEQLLISLKSVNHEIEDVLPASVTRFDDRFAVSMDNLSVASASAKALDILSDDMVAKLSSLERLIDAQRTAVARLMDESGEHFSARHEQADALAAALLQTRALVEKMAEDANGKLVGSILRVRETTRQAADSSRKILDEELAHIADKLTAQNNAALSGAVDSQLSGLDDAVREAIERNITLSQTAAGALAAQLTELDEMATNLEQRLAGCNDSFESVGDDSFARRMVLLTESLNSTAIDVAKILSNDVTDTAWAAYLKGDRGVFTRRAVRLLDAGEARAIAAHYSDDSEFREHVNRYIHDFESMMRVLLSTRDGNAIGVTLLSSDVGKLYVALAQAIERLRN